MKVRIKFQKYGAMKFVGHLDVMRYFQKAFRRAQIDNEYSKGFNPHPIMSFAAPLGVGLTADGEYLDAQILSCDEPEVMIDRMNAVMSEGFRIIGFSILKERELNEKKITAMSLVSSADYLVSLKDGYPQDDRIATSELFIKKFSAFLSQKEIPVVKKTKTQEIEVDIRPMITLSAYDGETFSRLRDEVLASEYILKDSSNLILAGSKADVYENGIKVYLQLHTGSAENLKPELVMEEFCKYADIPYQDYAWQVHRIELYTIEKGQGKLIPLDQLEQ